MQQENTRVLLQLYLDVLHTTRIIYETLSLKEGCLKKAFETNVELTLFFNHNLQSLFIDIPLPYTISHQTILYQYNY